MSFNAIMLSLPHATAKKIKNADDLCDYLYAQLINERKGSDGKQGLLRLIRANHNAGFFRLSDRIINRLKRFEL